MSPAPLLIHLHIPKNAGTSLGRMLKFGFLMRPPTNILRARRTLGYYSIGGFENRIAIMDTLPERARQRVRFFEAHCGWGVHERLPQPSRYMTLLRDPIDRTLSVYHYLRETRYIDPETTLEAFLAAPPPGRVWWVDNAQVRFLAGSAGVIDDRPVGAVTAAMLDLARTRLGAFLHVGITERFSESTALLLRKLGWGHGWYVRSNVTRERSHSSDLPAELLERIRELNQHDQALYEQECQRFEDEVRQAGDGLQHQIDRFDRRSATATKILAPALARRAAKRRARLSPRAPVRGADIAAQQPPLSNRS